MAKRESQRASHWKRMAANFLLRFSEPNCITTVTECVMSENLRHVTCFLRVFPKNKRDEVILFVNRNKGTLRREAAKESRSHFVPDFVFAADPSEAIDDVLGGLRESK